MKNIFDSGGLFKDVQQYLESKLPHKRYGFSELQREVFVDMLSQLS